MKFRKLPVEIEAVRWHKVGDHEEVIQFPCIKGFSESAEKNRCQQCKSFYSEHGGIETLEGLMTVCPGDWIITGVHGEHYPCKNDIFWKTYEKVKGE